MSQGIYRQQLFSIRVQGNTRSPDSRLTTVLLNFSRKQCKLRFQLKPVNISEIIIPLLSLNSKSMFLSHACGAGAENWGKHEKKVFSYLRVQELCVKDGQWLPLFLWTSLVLQPRPANISTDITKPHHHPVVWTSTLGRPFQVCYLTEFPFPQL